MIGPCAARVVRCTIVTKDDEHIIGTNFCYTSVSKCPRKHGEDYTKCQDVCTQAAHAEVVALIRAGDKARGATAYIEGHWRVCGNCRAALTAAGIESVNIGIINTGRLPG